MDFLSFNQKLAINFGGPCSIFSLPHLAMFGLSHFPCNLQLLVTKKLPRSTLL
jgi:hypothetical protein